jgi:hypothetical protein
VAETTGNPTIDALLAEATFTPLHTDWLAARQQRLSARFLALTVDRERKVLLLNATMGLPLYPSIVDFFALLQKTHPRIRVTSASYFSRIFELSAGVAKKGLEVVPVEELDAWGAPEFNRFDVVIAIGPSQALARLMALSGLRARLVCLDLAFYHQLIESSGGAFLHEKAEIGRRERRDDRAPVPGNRVAGYSCQPERKIDRDLLRAGFPYRAFTWRWFDYIPIGFAYTRYYRSDRTAFDLALLGSSGRKYADLDPASFRGRRVLFLGSAEGAAELARLRAEADVTVVSRVNEDVYARLLSLCRCVVLPGDVRVDNVFLSVLDALASGKPLITSRHLGIARLERAAAPIVFYEGATVGFWRWRRPTTPSPDLAAKVDATLRDEGKLRDLGDRALAFAREHLDIYRVLETILREQVL